MPVPALPPPAHPDEPSMLSAKFGREVANYFSGSPLNRLGFLRGEAPMLLSAVRHPSTNFVLCNNLQPLVHPGSIRLAYANYNDVQALVGDAYAESEEDLIKKFRSDTRTPQMIFLGVDEKASTDWSYSVKKGTYTGRPYFALDVTPRDSVKSAAEALIKTMEGRGLSFAQGRAMELEASDAAIFAESRQLLDWNARNPFCAQCGNATLSVNAGFKRTCPPTDLAAALSTSERPACATRTGISNVCFPRTDPTVIMAVVNAAGTHLLLGRQTRYPKYWYSVLAGFCEPAESVEEAVRREVWEEAGVHVGRVVVHSTQPWPYPANLMIGAIGQSVPGGEEIDLGNDPELEDAKWVSFDEVREALRVGTSGLDEGAGKEYKEGDLRLPANTAIANQLMTAVVSRGFLGNESKI